MADKNLYNSKDSMDISELASLNEDISPELIEQLQQKLEQESNMTANKKLKPFDENDNTTLFEEPTEDTNKSSSQTEEKDNLNNSDNAINKEESNPQDSIKSAKDNFSNKNFDDNFLKKYKAKLNKQSDSHNSKEVINETVAKIPMPEKTEPIEKITKGNITEKKITKEQKKYNDSLDFLDGNVKYSKYVIYIDPQNVDFIESLTVKERKNLINNILREQDDIAITKRRFKIINTIIRHSIIALLTIAIFIPIIYWTLNASIEATINNYRQSQSNFQQLYKHNGKISTPHK